jgi:hypothetical protein
MGVFEFLIQVLKDSVHNALGCFASFAEFFWIFVNPMSKQSCPLATRHTIEGGFDLSIRDCVLEIQ